MYPINLDPLYLDSLESLRDIPGIGRKTAERLKDSFGSEESALEEIRNGDVVSLSSVSDLSEGDASRIIKNAIAEEYRSENPLKTESLSDIYGDLLNRIKERARTKYGKARLDIYFPVSSEERIEEVREWVDMALSVRVDGSIEESMERVSTLKVPDRIHVDDRIILTDDLGELERIQEEIPGAQVDLVDDYRELRDYVREYETIFVLGDEFSGIDIDSESIERIPGGLEDPLEVFPEIVLNFFTENLESIENAIEVRKRVEAPFLDDIDGERIEKVENLLSNLAPDGTVKREENIRRLENALERMGDVIERAESRANDRFEKLLDDKEITIRGSDLRGLVKNGGEADDLIRSELGDDFDRIVEEAVEEIVSELDLDYEEEAIAQDLFVQGLELPLEADKETVSRLRDELRRKHSWKSLETKTQVARELEDLQEGVEDLVDKVLELDAALAVKEFTEENSMTMPEFDGRGFDLKSGKNIFIDNPESIDYKVEGVRLLTGVNSGGKTSALDLVAQSYVLAHMGFPVPAEEARIEMMEEFYYYRNIKKTMSSGALENILKRFERLLDSEGSKIVLVDELENITEPGASAKIVSGILDILKTDGSVAVFVSHLADKIMEKANFEIPVDGIEPEGLDEDMNLVVDRSPKRDLLATSTPELVVKKLGSRSNSEFYDELLEKFDGS